MKRWLIVLAAALAALQLRPPFEARAQCGTAEPAYEDKVLALNPIAYWQLEETSGTTAADSSGNSRDGTYSGATLNADTFINGDPAPSFDGVNDSVDIFSSGFASDLDMKINSVSMWIKVSGSGIWSEPTTARRAISLAVNSANEFSMYRYGVDTINANWWFSNTGAAIPYSSISTLDWFHVVRTVDHPDVVFYVDGVQRNTATISDAGTSGPIASGYLGRFAPSAQQYWSGYIAHAAVFDYELNATQVADLYDVPTGATPTPCPTTNYQVWETLQPQSTADPGQLVRFDYVVTAGGQQIATLANWLLYSIWGMFFFVVFLVLRRRRGNG